MHITPASVAACKGSCLKPVESETRIYQTIDDGAVRCVLRKRRGRQRMSTVY